MYLTLSHNSLDYYGGVIIYDSNRDCDIFNYTFTCSKEEAVLNVLDELTHFGTTIGETTRRLTLNRLRGDATLMNLQPHKPWALYQKNVS